MMKFIEFNQEKCDNCYKCLRICPTKAISFNKDSRHIIDNLCIKCGLCQQSCPKEALQIRSRVNVVKELLKRGEKVAVSVAPSFAGAFGMKEPRTIVGALKSYGVTVVEETAIGAELVSEVYDSYIDDEGQNVLITSCCPSANYLIEQHFPHLIPKVIPVVSPMIAHGRSLKQRYGEDLKVVFIGPCMAKMAEAEEVSGAVDYVLTFEELSQMMRSEGKNLCDYEPEPFDIVSYSRGRSYPLGGSLEGSSVRNSRYRSIHVEGIEACKAILGEIRTGSITDCCIEINICEGSCMNGPDMPKNHLGRFARELYMHQYIESAPAEIADRVNLPKPEMDRTFVNKQSLDQEPNIQMVRQTMCLMGKFTEEDEQNCGACGYKTCYDKAKAVFMGYSDIETCLPYLREKAESMQNIMVQNSPNAVILIDKELNIKEVNPSFRRMLNKENFPYEDLPIKLFVNHDIFDAVIQDETSIQNRKIYVEELESFFLVNVVYMEETQMILAFMTDITVGEQSKKEFLRVKEETLLKTQEVIDNQMRVAQEIASLLGETTAETKMSLKSLNELVMNDWGQADGV